MNSKIEQGLLSKVDNRDIINGHFNFSDEITAIAYKAFAGLADLNVVTLLQLKAVGGFAFKGCVNLTKVHLPQTIDIWGCAFERCSRLVDANLPKVETIWGRAFFYCTSLTFVNLPQVKRIAGEAFKNCHNLTTAILPQVSEIEDCVFTNCSYLKTVVLSAQTEIYRNSFLNCHNLKYLVFDDINHKTNIDVIRKKLPQNLQSKTLLLKSEEIKKRYLFNEVLKQNLHRDVHSHLVNCSNQLMFFGTKTQHKICAAETSKHKLN